MTICTSTIQIHQLTLEDFQALEHSYKIINHLTETYGNKCRLVCPNDGEIVDVDELPRVLGILSFLMYNRVVDVEAKT